MPTSYPAEFRRRAIALLRSGWSVTKTAHDLDVTSSTICNWVRQDRIDRGEIVGVSTRESKELVRARRRIRELETEVEILRYNIGLIPRSELRDVVRLYAFHTQTFGLSTEEQVRASTMEFITSAGKITTSGDIARNYRMWEISPAFFNVKKYPRYD